MGAVGEAVQGWVGRRGRWEGVGKVGVGVEG